MEQFGKLVATAFDDRYLYKLYDNGNVQYSYDAKADDYIEFYKSCTGKFDGSLLKMAYMLGMTVVFEEDVDNE